jgi:hypothetical protein
LRRIRQCLGVLALVALAAASISAGPASAATRPPVRTKAQWQAAMAQVRERGTGCYRASYPALQWHAATCAVAPKFPVVPARTPGSATPTVTKAVGNGHDYSAQVSGLISHATGSFHNVSSGITEKGKVGNSGPNVANAFSLQLNTQFFATPLCSSSGDPANCLGWQQFVYVKESGAGFVFMQYWLINWDTTCPSGWFTFSTDCYTNSNSTTLSSPLTARQLATVKLSGSAASGGQDEVSVSVGSGQAVSVTNSDSEIDLARFWNTTEWGVYGDGGGGQAIFGTNTTLEAQTALTATSSTKPTCVKEGFTGETNNLKLAHTPALGAESSPTMASKQTNGTTGTASCATAA